MLICGDCKTELQKIEQNSIDLIYLDPPFFTQKKQTLKKIKGILTEFVPHSLEKNKICNPEDFCI